MSWPYVGRTIGQIYADGNKPEATAGAESLAAALAAARAEGRAEGIAEGLEKAARWLGTEAQKCINLADSCKPNSSHADVVRLEARRLVRYSAEIRSLPPSADGGGR